MVVLGMGVLICKGEGKTMETVQDVKMKLYIQTDKRKVEEGFGNLLDMRVFMDRFFLRWPKGDLQRRNQAIRGLKGGCGPDGKPGFLGLAFPNRPKVNLKIG
jgi:hypothetical protein